MTTYKPIHRLALAAGWEQYDQEITSFYTGEKHTEKWYRAVGADHGVQVGNNSTPLRPEDVATVLGWLAEAGFQTVIPEQSEDGTQIVRIMQFRIGFDSLEQAAASLEAALYSAVAKLFPKEKTNA